MLKFAKLIPAIAAAAMVAGTSLPASAMDSAMDSRTTFSSTAGSGFYYNEGAWVKSEMVPHVMRQTDTRTVTSSVAGAGFLRDEGVYTRQVEIPHTMAPHTTGSQVSATPKPGFVYDEGGYREAQ